VFTLYHISYEQHSNYVKHVYISICYTLVQRFLCWQWLMNWEFELLVYSEYPYFTIHQTMIPGDNFNHYVWFIINSVQWQNKYICMVFSNFISDGKVIIQFVQNHLSIFCFSKWKCVCNISYGGRKKPCITCLAICVWIHCCLFVKSVLPQ